MAPTPPDPHVRKRNPGLAIIIAVIVIIAGVVIVFANKPGAGMGGSISSGPEQSQR
jgi:preprotein translocase subunit SecG